MNEKGGIRKLPIPLQCLNCKGSLNLDLNESDNKRVKDERFDQREADDHRHEDLTAGGRVARDALEGRAGRFALAERSTEGGETDRETGADRGIRIATGGVTFGGHRGRNPESA